MPKERARLQVEVTDQTTQQLQFLLKETNLPSNAQVIRVAVQLLAELYQDQKTGSSILVVKEGQPPERLKLVF
jgi:hypothetical protein